MELVRVCNDSSIKTTTKDSLIEEDSNRRFMLPECFVCLSEIRLKMEWVGFLRKSGYYSDEGFLLSKSSRFALNVVKLLFICQACADERIVSKHACLRRDYGLAGLGVGISIDKQTNIAQKPIVLDVFDSDIKRRSRFRRNRNVKLHDDRFHVETNEADDVKTCASFEYSVLDYEDQSNTVKDDFGMIAENISCLGENTNAEDDFAHFGFSMIEFGLDSCATSHIVNDLSLFIPGTVVELKNNGVKGVSGTAVISKRGDAEIFIFCSDGKRHKHVL